MGFFQKCLITCILLVTISIMIWTHFGTIYEILRSFVLSWSPYLYFFIFFPLQIILPSIVLNDEMEHDVLRDFHENTTNIITNPLPLNPSDPGNQVLRILKESKFLPHQRKNKDLMLLWCLYLSWKVTAQQMWFWKHITSTRLGTKSKDIVIYSSLRGLRMVMRCSLP